MSNKLTDMQLVLLSAAWQRDDHCLTLPTGVQRGSARKAAAKLLEAGLVKEVRARKDAPMWRRDEETEQPFALNAEARRAEQTPNPDSMDFYFQGRALINRGFAPEMLAKAREFYERALELDPGNIDALVGVAGVDVLVCISDMTDDPQALLAEAEARLIKALAATPNNAYAHLLMGVVLRATYRAQRSVEELERALAIDPNLAGARALMGSALACMGRAQEAEAHVLEALRLSPRDAMIFEWFLVAGSAKTLLGEFAEASAWLRKSIDANRNRPLAFFLLAACLAHLGRIDEARREVKAGLAVDPKFTLGRFRAGAQSDNAVYLAQRARVAEGMRLAGVAEG